MQIAENIESINQNKAPSKYIGNYAILDHLGSGAFGCVYKVTLPLENNLSYVPKHTIIPHLHTHNQLSWSPLIEK